MVRMRDPDQLVGTLAEVLSVKICHAIFCHYVMHVGARSDNAGA